MASLHLLESIEGAVQEVRIIEADHAEMTKRCRNMNKNIHSRPPTNFFHAKLQFLLRAVTKRLKSRAQSVEQHIALLDGSDGIMSSLNAQTAGQLPSSTVAFMPGQGTGFGGSPRLSNVPRLSSTNSLDFGQMRFGVGPAGAVPSYRFSPIGQKTPQE